MALSYYLVVGIDWDPFNEFPAEGSLKYPAPFIVENPLEIHLESLPAAGLAQIENMADRLGGIGRVHKLTTDLGFLSRAAGRAVACRPNHRSARRRSKQLFGRYFWLCSFPPLRRGSHNTPNAWPHTDLTWLS